MLRYYGPHLLQRPKPPFRVNWQSLQARGLVFWAPLWIADTRDYAGSGKNSLVPVSLLYDIKFDVTPTPEFGFVAKGDGTANAVITTAAGLGTLSGPLSLSMWFYGNSTTNPSHVFTIGTGAAGTNFGVRNSGVDIGLTTTKGSTGGVVLNSTSLKTVGWHHGVYTFDGTNNTLYFDGVADGTNTTAPDTGTITRVGLLVNSHNSFPEIAGAFWVADLRIYNKALTADEVARMYRLGSRWDLYDTAFVSPLVRPFTSIGGQLFQQSLTDTCDILDVRRSLRKSVLQESQEILDPSCSDTVVF